MSTANRPQVDKNDNPDTNINGGENNQNNSVQTTITEQPNPSPQPQPQAPVFGMRKSADVQQKPRATGSRLMDFEIFLCVHKFGSVPITHKGKQRWSLASIKVTDRVGKCKVEPHLVYGSKQFGTVGYNDNILLDLGIPFKLYFPKGTVNSNEEYPAGDIIIDTVIGGTRDKPIVGERKFHFFEYKGSKKLKEMAAECRNDYEYKNPAQL